jgi:small subunit ribosomal protein S20
MQAGYYFPGRQPETRACEEEPLANHKSALKRIRQNNVRRLRNRIVRSRVRTYAKSLHEAIASGDAETAKSSLKQATSEYFKAVSKGVVKKETASRSVSRLARAVNKMQAGA